jgi:quercetin dioxygenase-like cupin family protein
MSTLIALLRFFAVSLRKLKTKRKENMNPLTQFKTIRLLSLLVALALVAVAAPARATLPSGVTTVPIADGTFNPFNVFAAQDLDPRPGVWGAVINTHGKTHFYVLQNTVTPGGTFGWHRHPGPSLVFVVSGAATEYEGNDPTCTPHVREAGSTFIDRGEVSGHLVRNEGSVDLVVVVVRLVPEGFPQRIDLPNPGHCPNIN